MSGQLAGAQADDHGQDQPEGHSGPVVLVLPDGSERYAEAHLVSRFDPLAGRTVWTGRVAAELAPRTQVVIRTPHGESRAEAVEQDVWGNTRVRGVGRPPFPVELLDAAGR